MNSLKAKLGLPEAGEVEKWEGAPQLFNLKGKMIAERNYASRRWAEE
jgi:hypothetical protein